MGYTQARWKVFSVGGAAIKMHDVTSEGRAPANLGGAVAIVDGGGGGGGGVLVARLSNSFDTE